VSWTTPATWVDGTTPDETEFNEQVRDNLLVLKASRNDAGLFLGLTSTYLADLSGLNIAELAKLASANTFTELFHVNGTSPSSGRLVIPIIADADGVAAGAGSLWLSTDDGDVKFRNEGDTTTFRCNRTFVGSGTGNPGSLWVEGSDLHYITDFGGPSVEYYVTPIIVGAVTAAARGGSIWVEGNDLHWIRETGTSELRASAF